MLKHPITYTNYDDEVVTDTFYFNLSKPELVEMNVEYKRGLGAFMQSIIEAKDDKTLLAKFKEIVLLAYGVREEDRFVKSDELRERFSQTAAYQQLFMDLATNDELAADWLLGILPKDLVSNLTDTQIKDLREGKQPDLAEKSSEATESVPETT